MGSGSTACNARDPVLSLGLEDPLDNGMATHSSILVWKIPWTEEPGRLQSMGLQRVEHNWVTNIFSFTSTLYIPSNLLHAHQVSVRVGIQKMLIKGIDEWFRHGLKTCLNPLSKLQICENKHWTHFVTEQNSVSLTQYATKAIYWLWIVVKETIESLFCRTSGQETRYSLLAMVFKGNIRVKVAGCVISLWTFF